MRIINYDVEGKGSPTPEFLKLSISELKALWVKCEQEKMLYHPESAFQRLVDNDMALIATRLKQLRHQKQSQWKIT